MRAFVKRLSPAAKGALALVAPVATILTTLLALGVITPFGTEDALASGARNTQDAATSRLSLTYSSRSEGGTPTEFSAAGVFDYRQNRGALTYDFSGTPAYDALTGVEMRFLDRLVFMHFPAEVLDGPRRWIRVDLDKAEETLAVADEAAGGSGSDLGFLSELELNDPSAILAVLERGRDVKELGEEELFNVPVRVYRATVDAGGRELTATAWIDDDELIRRLRLTSDEGPEPFELVMDLSDFGTEAGAEAPPSEQVIDLETLVTGGTP